MSKQVSFCFQGWISKASIKTAFNPKTGEDVDVQGLSHEEFVSKLKSGELTISIEDCLNHCKEVNIELFDFE